jgi:undecaprenyl-diphosphatase
MHVGTLCAIIYFFREDIRNMWISISDVFRKQKMNNPQPYENKDIKIAILIIVGTFPTAIIGSLLHEFAHSLYSSPSLVGVMWIITGIVLWRTRTIGESDKTFNFFSLKDALIIGTCQGFAAMPGISRSGITISMGLFLGLDRETAGRYSFLLSIPAILGAELMGANDWLVGRDSFGISTIIGMLTAAMVGYFVLILLLYIVKKGNIYMFAPYCWFMAVVALFFV